MIVLFRSLAPQGWRIVLSIALGTVVVASNMGLLAAAAYLIAAASVSHLMALLIFPMYAVRVLSGTRGAGRYAERVASHRVTFEALARMRIWLFDRIALLGPAGMSGIHSGDALGRVLADVEELQGAYLLLITPIAVALLVTVLLASILVTFSTVMAWTMLAYIVLCGVIVPGVELRATLGPGRREVLVRAQLNAHLVDCIQGSRDIVTNDAGSRYLERGLGYSRLVAKAQTFLSDIAAGREAAGELFSNLAMLTALALAVPLVTSHRITPLYLVVPALLTLAAFEALRPIGTAAGAVAEIVAAGQRVVQLDAGTMPAVRSTGSRPIRPPYSLAFEGVTMRYNPDQRPALQDVTLTVPDGAHIAIVGPSGAGKSTLVHLLTRARDASEGRILLGGHPIQEYALRDVRTVLGVVAQDTYVFNASIRSNLRLARATATDSEMEGALELAGLLDLVRALPAGLDTWVGEHGQHLSGGERQRLAVARMLLEDAPIVVLDELTANLDAGTEADLLHTLRRVTRERTTVMVTHRLIELESMDEIVVLDRGRVVQRGKHSELVTSGGLYRQLLDTQDNMVVL